MKLSLTFALFLVAAALAHARLTEKEHELIKRFGKIETRTVQNRSFQGRTYRVGEVLSFRSEQWRISALMIDDRCAQITYSKTGDWTDEQIVGLLDRNGGYATFKEGRTSLGKSHRTWTQANGVTARFSLNALEITHPLLQRRLDVLESKANAESKRAPKF